MQKKKGAQRHSHSSSPPPPLHSFHIALSPSCPPLRLDSHTKKSEHGPVIANKLCCPATRGHKEAADPEGNSTSEQEFATAWPATTVREERARQTKPGKEKTKSGQGGSNHCSRYYLCDVVLRVMSGDTRRMPSSSFVMSSYSWLAMLSTQGKTG